jgi:hypothetical protein
VATEHLEQIPGTFPHLCRICRGTTEFSYIESDHDKEKGYRFECTICKKQSTLILFRSIVYCFGCRRLMRLYLLGYDDGAYIYGCGQCDHTMRRKWPYTDDPAK